MKKLKINYKVLIVLLILFISLSSLKYKHYMSKNKDIDYVVNKYFTSGIFNKFKMYDINNLNLFFSNGNIAVVHVSGFSASTPHKRLSCNAFLEKQNSGIWKVKKVYYNENEIVSEK